MSCPLNRNRWAGSGYVKESAPSAAAKELNTKMLEIQAARSAQDNKYFPSSVSEPATAAPPQKLINTPVVRK